MKNVLVVSNYNAGRKKAIIHKKLLIKFLLKNCECFKFISIDELNDINLDDYDIVFAVGGDGTVNKVATSIINTDKILGIIPCGTANLLAAKLGLSTNLKKTIKIIKNGNLKDIDVININGIPGILRIGMGYDSDIICKTPQTLKNKFGYLAYFIAGIIFALRLKNKEYKMIIDGENKCVKASCIIFANTSNMYRNMVSLVDNSKLNDGLMDIFILKTTNPIIFFFEFIKIILNLKKNNRNTEYKQAKTVVIENSWTVCHIDGEKKNLKENINISVQKHCLKTFCQ